MKTLQIFGNDLFLQIETTRLSPVNNPAYSFAIGIEFMGGEKGKLIIHSRDVLIQKKLNHYVSSFTATLITNELFNQLCTGIYCQNKEIKEAWITIVDEKFT